MPGRRQNSLIVCSNMTPIVLNGVCWGRRPARRSASFCSGMANSVGAREKIAATISDLKMLAAIAPQDTALAISEKLIACYEILGDLSRSSGDFAAAVAGYTEWLDLSSKLANQATDPGRVDYWLSYAADAHLHLGDMLQQQQKYSDATVEYRAGLVIASRLNADDPEIRNFLSICR